MRRAISVSFILVSPAQERAYGQSKNVSVDEREEGRKEDQTSGQATGYLFA